MKSNKEKFENLTNPMLSVVFQVQQENAEPHKGKALGDSKFDN